LLSELAELRGRLNEDVNKRRLSKFEAEYAAYKVNMGKVLDLMA
jgi:hypothetical protein